MLGLNWDRKDRVTNSKRFWSSCGVPGAVFCCCSSAGSRFHMLNIQRLCLHTLVRTNGCLSFCFPPGIWRQVATNQLLHSGDFLSFRPYIISIPGYKHPVIVFRLLLGFLKRFLCFLDCVYFRLASNSISAAQFYVICCINRIYLL